MIARRDVVRCFSCHVVLQDWERTDNVIEEHQRHSPDCLFLKLYLYKISASSRVSSIGMTFSPKQPILNSRNYPNTQCHTTLTTLGIRQPPSTMEQSDDQIQGIIYPPSWRSNPPTSSSLPKAQNLLNYNSLTSLQSMNTRKEIAVSSSPLCICVLRAYCVCLLVVCRHAAM